MKNFFLTKVTLLAMMASGIIMISCRESTLDVVQGANDDNQLLPESILTVVSGDDLASILSKATPKNEIRIGKGIFKGTFEMKDGVQVSGGWNEDFTAIDVVLYPTILDGERKSQVLVQNTEFATRTVWSNITIRNGVTSSNGGGVYIRGNGVLENCIISGNSALGLGGGVYAAYGAEIIGCTITDNESDYNGGGAYVCGKILDCIIEENRATRGCGGGVQLQGKYNSENVIEQVAIMDRCVVKGNFAKNGGGVRTWDCALIANSSICNNSTSQDRNVGSGVTLNGQFGTVVNSTIYGNNNTSTVAVADNGGRTRNAGIYSDHSTMNVINTIIWGNSWATPEQGDWQVAGRYRLLSNCVFSQTEINNSTYGLLIDETNQSFGGMDSIVTLNRVLTAQDGNQLRFANAAVGDFTLLANSICIDAGMEIPANMLPPRMIIAKDLSGNNRITGASIDIGAYEYQQNY